MQRYNKKKHLYIDNATFALLKLFCNLILSVEKQSFCVKNYFTG